MQLSIENDVSVSLSEKLKDIHQERILCGESPNAILNLPEALLIYLVSILKNQSPKCPELKEAEWLDFLSLLKPHYLAPLIYRLITFLPKETHPPDYIMNEMRRAFLESHARSLKAEQQLFELLKAFQNSGIRTLILKGPALSKTVYPDPTMRFYINMDLLVHPKHVRTCRKILTHLGYKDYGQLFAFKNYSLWKKEFIHKDKQNYLLIELQFQLHHFFALGRGLKIEDLFAQASKVELPLFSFETLNPFDAILNSSIHLALSHRTNIKLIWIYDINLLLKRLKTLEDWKLLGLRCVAGGAEAALAYSLKMLEAWTDFKLPYRVEDFCSLPRSKKGGISVCLDVDTKRSRLKNEIGILSLIFRYSTLTQKVVLLFYLIFPPISTIRTTYPPSVRWFLPLSYLKRWTRWFKIFCK